MKNTLHIYTRVSSSAQEEGTSLDNQKNLGIKKAEELDTPYRVWNEGGKSSFHDDLNNRPALVELLTEIEDGQVKNLFVYNTDRLSRNQKTWGMIRIKLLEHKVTLHTASGRIELKNPMDDLLLGIMSEISQYDNKIRTERSRQGRFLKIQQGSWRGGPPPFGYRIEEKQLVVDEYESKWIRTMFEMYAQRQSTNQIRQKLNTNGVVTRRGRSNWSLGSIQKILGNTVYIGHYHYTDKSMGETVRVPTPVIIDVVTFDSAQLVRKTTLKRKQQQNPTKRFYLLRDLMVCGHCGSHMSGRTKESRNENHYYCPKKERDWVKGKQNSKKWERGVGCTMVRSLNIPKTNELVWSTVLGMVEDSYHLREEFRGEILPRIIENRSQGALVQGKIKAKIKRIQRDVSELDKTISNFETDVLLKRHSGNPNLIRRNLKDEKVKVLEKLESAKEEYKFCAMENSWVDWLAIFKSDIQKKIDLTDIEKKDYLLKIVESITVHFDAQDRRHKLEIAFKVPIVNDQIIYNNPENRTEGWTIEDGDRSLNVDGILNGGPGRPSKKNNRDKQCSVICE
jgi:DNA invertase Pin-like site-specific DNA recombinase